MPLTPQELEIARTLRLQGKSTDEVFNYIAGKRINAPSRLSTVRREPAVPTNTGHSVIKDIPQDILTGVKQLGEGYIERYGKLQESFESGKRGEQSPFETGTQLGANIAGGLIADPAYQLLRTGASFITTPEEETKIAEGVGQAVQTAGEKTGITDWYSSQSPRTQRNINAALDLADVVPVGIFGKAKSLLSRTPQTDTAPVLQQALDKAEQGNISDATRVANATLDETTRATEVDKLAKAYQDSLVGDRVKVNRLLQEQANDMSRGDVVMTQDQLIRNLADEGIIPDIRGKLADFTTEIRNLSDRQNKLFAQYEPILTQSRATAGIDDFANYAKNSMADSRNLRFELDKANAQLDRLISNLRQGYKLDEGGSLTAKQIDEISREANARSKAYREGGDTFQADVYSELGRAARSWLGENIPDNAFRQVNDQWLRLEQLKRTAEAMQNQQVDVGLLGRALGSYVTTLTGVTLAAGVSNPFTAVAAGILTKMGGDAIADAMRSTRFSPEVRQKLQERLSRDAELRESLKETATTQQNKNLIDDLSRMLPAPKPGAVRSEVTGGAPIRITQEGVGVQRGDVAETTRPGAVRRSDSKPQSTEVSRAIREDDDAVAQAVSEMEAEMTGDTRTSFGDNKVQGADGGYYRFNELPSWVPERFRDGALMSKVMENIVSGKKPRVNATNEIELQKIVEGHIAKRVDEIKKGKGDQGIFTGDTAFAVALMAGGSYFLMNEDSQMLPVVAIGSMMANPAGRKAALASAKKVAEKGGKLTPSYKRKIAEALEDYDAGFIDVQEEGLRRSIAPDAVDQRIEELQEQNFSGKFSDKDALEAEELMANKGIFLEPDSPKAKGATPQTTALDPKNFKTSEDFISKQPTKLFHRTNVEFDDFDIDKSYDGMGTWFFTKKEMGDDYVKESPILMERYLDRKLNMITETQMDKLMNSKEFLNSDKGLREFLLDKGFEGINFGDGIVQVLDTKPLKTRAQLENIWKQANQ